MSSTVRHVIPTGLTEKAKRQFDSMMLVHSRALSNFREFLSTYGYVEITESSLIDIAGSCRTSLTSPQFPFGAPAQSCQYQLEVLAVGFNRAYFTVNSGFEKIKETPGKRRRLSPLSSFTSIEGVSPFRELPTDAAFGRISSTIEDCIKFATRDLVEQYHHELSALGSDLNYLVRMLRRPFIRISYEEALTLLNDQGKNEYHFGHELGQPEEREILSYFCNIPVLINYNAADLQHFTVKRCADGKRAFRTDLLLPKLGLSAFGKLFEERRSELKRVLVAREGISPLIKDSAVPYLNIFDCEDPGPRGGFTFSFERFVGFLLGTRLF